MHKTGIEDHYIIKDNRKLRFGYTTGSCAAAAAKAAALMLLSGGPVHFVDLATPKGILLTLAVLDINMRPGAVSCAVRKDAGDDPDVTDGILVYAEVSFPDGRTWDSMAETAASDALGTAASAALETADNAMSGKKEGTADSDVTGMGRKQQIVIEGGKGVGRVTRKGMKQAVGEAAINSVPRQMIENEVRQVCDDFDYAGTLRVVISIPEGEALAGKTFNPRLGIEGGISILGTSGIVEPMSEEALLESIRLEMNMRRAAGCEYLAVVPGNYGEEFAKEFLHIDLSAAVKCSNYVGRTLDMAAELGFRGILFVSHIGKFIKVAGGIMNTHSREADCRAELMAAFAVRAGADAAAARQILGTAVSDEALGIMDGAGIMRQAMALAAARAREYLQHRCAGRVVTEVILFSQKYGFLAQTEGAAEMLERLT